MPPVDNGSSSSGSDSGSSSDLGSSSSTSSYLNYGVENSDSRAGVGVSVAALSSFGIGTSIVTGSASVITGATILQCQYAQLFSLFNMNKHVDYVKFSQSYSLTKLDLKFLDFIQLQDALEDETRRNLKTKGYTDLSNVRIETGSFLVNYIYWFLIILII